MSPPKQDIDSRHRIFRRVFHFLKSTDMTETRYVTAEDAVSKILSGDRVFVHGSAATPNFLLKALANRHKTLKKVEIISVSTLGELAVAEEEMKESFYFNSLFVSQNVRQAVNSGRGDYVPIFLSEIPKLFRENYLKLDVALIHVSPPDKHGFCSLGVSVDVARSAVTNAHYVIAQVNKNMPRTHGDGLIHVREIDVLVECSDELPEVNYKSQITLVEKQIGEHCATLIEDGSTLQLGIGVIPDAVLQELYGHKDLGIHSEMFSDGVIDLLENGVVTNRKKAINRDKIVTAFSVGSKRLYDFVDDNPLFDFLGTDYVNDSYVISRNPKVIAINSAIEIDITGQVCADSIGTYQYSGVGGQMDFLRGAALSEGGKPIIALASTTKRGESKIVPFLRNGAGVVTTRAHMHYVVTEYGIAQLFGKNTRQRAHEMVRIAHPDHRETLDKEVFFRFGKTFY